MNAYEIRIIHRDRIAAVHCATLLGDHAAIRRARTLAHDGDRIEIWRGAICIYAAHRQSELSS